MNHLVNISEAVSLAFHGLAIIVEKEPQKMKTSKMAEELNVSKHHLAKIFQLLTKREIVKSTRGPQGGFILNKPANEITFLEIYELLESKINLTECPLGYNSCYFENCIFGDKLNIISQEIYETFKKITLIDLIKK